MRANDVVVVDYGLGNILSVTRALEYCGGQVTVTSCPDKVSKASRLVLPGVGAFIHGMAELKSRCLVDALLEFAHSGYPILGVCLGMQLLFDESTEYGISSGLGLISGRVVEIPSIGSSGLMNKVPHIGWGSLMLPELLEHWDGTLLEGIHVGDSTYFVHSYMVEPVQKSCIIANCKYGDISIPAAVMHNNIYGCQFHPEKSGKVGMAVLRKFLLS